MISQRLDSKFWRKEEYKFSRKKLNIFEGLSEKNVDFSLR